MAGRRTTLCLALGLAVPLLIFCGRSTGAQTPPAPATIPADVDDLDGFDRPDDSGPLPPPIIVTVSPSPPVTAAVAPSPTAPAATSAPAPATTPTATTSATTATAASPMPGGATSATAKPAVAANRKHPPVTYSLPSEFLDKDKDKDGQIGLYEWSRSDLPAFHKFDLDRDGFLTPFEVLKGTGKIPSTVIFAKSVQIAPALSVSNSTPTAGAESNRDTGRGEGGRRGRNGGGRRGGSREESEGGPTTDSVNRDPLTQRAEWAFTQMDRDRNDKIDQEEWSRSRTVRAAVEKANLTVSTPLSKSDFVELFKKTSPAQ